MRFEKKYFGKHLDIRNKNFYLCDPEYGERGRGNRWKSGKFIDLMRDLAGLTGRLGDLLKKGKTAKR